MNEKFFFGGLFSEEIVANSIKITCIFDPGTSVKKSIRGTEIVDTRPFVMTDNKIALGSKLERLGQCFNIASVEESSSGLLTYFLEEWRDGSDDYLG